MSMKIVQFLFHVVWWLNMSAEHCRHRDGWLEKSLFASGKKSCWDHLKISHYGTESSKSLYCTVYHFYLLIYLFVNSGDPQSMIDMLTRKHNSTIRTARLCRMYVLHRQMSLARGGQMSWGPMAGRGPGLGLVGVGEWALYSEVQCIMGNGHMAWPLLWTDIHI